MSCLLHCCSWLILPQNAFARLESHGCFLRICQSIFKALIKHILWISLTKELFCVPVYTCGECKHTFCSTDGVTMQPAHLSYLSSQHIYLSIYLSIHPSIYLSPSPSLLSDVFPSKSCCILLRSLDVLILSVCSIKELVPMRSPL